MAKVIAVGNFKGGVGKTTASANLAFALKERGFKVLVVDLDAQGHAGQYISGDEEISNNPGGSELLLDEPAELTVTHTESGIDVMHGHRALGQLDEGDYTGEDAMRLRPYMANLPYDFIIIDTPPSMAFRMIAALMWADYYLLVTKPDSLTMDSTKQMLQVLAGWIRKKWVKPGFRFGIVMNLVDRSSVTLREEAQEARDTAPQYFLPTELTYRRDAFNKAYKSKIPIWQVPRIPKDVALAWRNLPEIMGVVDKEATA
ncbi:ParA family protein [Xanthomonas campestris pv. campestris]|uniref:ParA family protein n=1 Tax=Xanthomonas campestris TaxID=339 RepID=UPI001E5E8F45|nr:ParA family protein [Xanthomonas campestris]MCD0253084.1 ParA family protein [Xanthomonas campestris pv. campestris]